MIHAVADLSWSGRGRDHLCAASRVERGADKGKFARLVSACCAAGKQRMMKDLTPASADDLPPLGELIVYDPFWWYPLALCPGRRSACGHGRF